MLIVEKFSKYSAQLLISGISLALSSSALACQPLSTDALSPDEVIKRFNSVDTVVVAKLVKSRKIGVKGTLNDFEMPGERATFRAVRVLKGRIKPGEHFVLTTTLSGCGISTVNDPPWLYSANGKPEKNLERDWLIYRNANDKTQITNSNYTKMLSTATSDLKILESFSKRNN